MYYFTFFSWFFENISRKEAEKLLLAEENPRGTFLVRPSEHNPNGYSLSVKDWEEYRRHHIKHYKIKPLDNGGFYISTNKTFDTLSELVNSYTSKSISLIFCAFSLIIFNQNKALDIIDITYLTTPIVMKRVIFMKLCMQV